MTQIIQQEELLKMTGYEQVGKAEKRLKEQGVNLIYGKNGRISTTLDALNKALGIEKSEKPSQDIEID